MAFEDETTRNERPRAMVEVEAVYEDETNTHEGPWSALQVWTKNRVYHVDWTMRCFQVVDLASGRADETHRLIGAVLTGGRRSGSRSMELTFPVPRPGVAAVFELPDQSDYITTSEVERVVLRLRVFEVGFGRDQRWKEISQQIRASLGTRPGH